MPKKLPVFNGYTIDKRLRQFRKMEKGIIIFVPFNTKRGRSLLEEIKSLYVP